MDDGIQDILTQQSQADLQQQQSGIQNSGGSAQAGLEQPQSGTAFSQDDFMTPVLRVEGSEATIQNTTSIEPSAQPYIPDYVNAAWLWLLVPIVLTMILFWPRKHKSMTRGAGIQEDGDRSRHQPEIVRPLQSNTIGNQAAETKVHKKKSKQKKRKHSR